MSRGRYEQSDRPGVHVERVESVEPGQGMFGCLRAIAVPATVCGALALLVRVRREGAS